MSADLKATPSTEPNTTHKFCYVKPTGNMRPEAMYFYDIVSTSNNVEYVKTEEKYLGGAGIVDAPYGICFYFRKNTPSDGTVTLRKVYSFNKALDKEMTITLTTSRTHELPQMLVCLQSLASTYNILLEDYNTMQSGSPSHLTSGESQAAADLILQVGAFVEEFYRL